MTPSIHIYTYIYIYFEGILWVLVSVQKKHTMTVKSPPTEAVAYFAMHELRLDYAIGKFDDDPECLESMKSAANKKDGQYFYEILDDIQVDMISVCFALGYIDDAGRRSVKEKFPDIRWESYDKASFERAVELFEVSDHPLAKDDVDRSGTDFGKLHFAGRAIGVYLQNQ